MGACDDTEQAFQDAIDRRDDLRDQLRQEQAEQFKNYKDYWRTQRDAWVEFFILALFGEGLLGLAFGGKAAFFSKDVNDEEEAIDELHNDIEQVKGDLADAEQAANDAASELCDCYAENGFG